MKRMMILAVLKFVAIISAIVTGVSLVVGEGIVMVVAGIVFIGAFCFYMDLKEESDEDR